MWYTGGSFRRCWERVVERWGIPLLPLLYRFPVGPWWCFPDFLPGFLWWAVLERALLGEVLGSSLGSSSSPASLKSRESENLVGGWILSPKLSINHNGFHWVFSFNWNCRKSVEFWGSYLNDVSSVWLEYPLLLRSLNLALDPLWTLDLDLLCLLEG